MTPGLHMLSKGTLAVAETAYDLGWKAAVSEIITLLNRQPAVRPALIIEISKLPCPPSAAIEKMKTALAQAEAET